MTANPSQESVGSRLKMIRKRRILTQADLSRLSHVGLQTIKDIERGVTVNPHPKTIRALAQALDVEASLLLFGEESP